MSGPSLDVSDFFSCRASFQIEDGATNKSFWVSGSCKAARDQLEALIFPQGLTTKACRQTYPNHYSVCDDLRKRIGPTSAATVLRVADFTVLKEGDKCVSSKERVSIPSALAVLESCMGGN